MWEDEMPFEDKPENKVGWSWLLFMVYGAMIGALFMYMGTAQLRKDCVDLVKDLGRDNKDLLDIVAQDDKQIKQLLSERGDLIKDNERMNRLIVCGVRAHAECGLVR